MKRNSLWIAAVVSVAPLACATQTGASTSSQSTSSTQGTSLLGRAGQYAATALAAAKSFLAQPSQQTSPDKQEAAQTGVNAANTQAQKQEGSALNQLEQQALLDYVKSKL